MPAGPIRAGAGHGADVVIDLASPTNRSAITPGGTTASSDVGPSRKAVVTRPLFVKSVDFFQVKRSQFVPSPLFARTCLTSPGISSFESAFWAVSIEAQADSVETGHQPIAEYVHPCRIFAILTSARRHSPARDRDIG